MTAIVVPAVRGRLLDTAGELIRESDGHPAGSVLRCFSKAVAAARLAGIPEEEVGEVATRNARATLARRAEGPQRRAW